MNFYKNSKSHRSTRFFKLVTKVRDIDKRNLIRGYGHHKKITTDQANDIRLGSSVDDCVILGALLKGPEGLLNESNNIKKPTCKNLFVITSYNPMEWKHEVCYTVGYLNSMPERVLNAINAMELIIKLNNDNGADVFDGLLQFAENFGASNFLSYKLAYFRNTLKLSPASLATISKIENEIKHRESPGFHVSALENISSNISLFLAAQRRVNGLSNKFNGNFRTAISLSNFVPTPLNLEDVSYFLLRATSSSLIDTLHSIIILFNLKSTFPEVYQEFFKRLDFRLLNRINSLIKLASGLKDENMITDHYISIDNQEDSSFLTYRISAAFLEREKYTTYRNKIDKVISVRLLTDIYNKYDIDNESSEVSKALLLNPNAEILDNSLEISLDSFYRTYLFLVYISNYQNIGLLKDEDVKFIFENTIYLDVLLTEKEIEILSASADPESAMHGLLSVLALALYKRKSIDPDTDFEFRSIFMMHVLQNYNGSIPKFVNSLLEDSPAIAQYIVESLDTVTLEKMYLLVDSSTSAAKIRAEILRAVGVKCQNIECIVEANRIETQFKLLPLQQYFDSSRMYVDSIAMKLWLDSNPTIATEDYRETYSILEDQLNDDENVGLALDALLSQVAKEAFEQFCLNAEFGIQSYLSRRIRHNTLDGITKEMVDVVLRKSDYDEVMDRDMKKNVRDWQDCYQNIVDELRCKHLQFESNTVSGALFNSTLNLNDKATQDNIRWLSTTLMNYGEKFLHELLITFCWTQITPQLENAARFIKTRILQAATDSIDKYFSNIQSPIEIQLKSELHDAVNKVFKKVADWFQVPQTGFVSASVSDLCQIISADLSEQKPLISNEGMSHEKYTGISVHRLYDCLAVLLQNAYKHGKGNELPIQVSVKVLESHVGVDKLKISVVSEIAEEQYETSKDRIMSAINSPECSTDMITEGYTGLSKIKFITRSNEGIHTVGCDFPEGKKSVTIFFILHAEKEVQMSSQEAI